MWSQIEDRRWLMLRFLAEIFECQTTLWIQSPVSKHLMKILHNKSTGRKDFGLVHLSTVGTDGLFSHTERTRERFESQSRKRGNFHTPITFNCPINQYELHQSCRVNY